VSNSSIGGVNGVATDIDPPERPPAQVLSVEPPPPDVVNVVSEKMSSGVSADVAVLPAQLQGSAAATGEVTELRTHMERSATEAAEVRACPSCKPPQFRHARHQHFSHKPMAARTCLACFE
jgi:hypothetical protein